MITFPDSGLYAITQTEYKSHHVILNEVKDVLDGGIAVLQYRNKQTDNHLLLANELMEICHHYGVPFIINDDIKLAKKVGADGVHLGKDDGTIQQAREYLGHQAIIGVSCYNNLNKAKNAESMGANYVAFGRFFASGSKPKAAAADIRTLQKAKIELKIPTVAIGGILPSNGHQLLSAGADFLAVIGGLFNQNPKISVQNYMKLFDEIKPDGLKK